MPKGTVNRILAVAEIDGFGNNTLIYMQGCNFNCQFCNAPERINHCTGCGFCIESCTVGALTLGDNGVEFNPELCTWCNDCVEACNYGSTPKAQTLSPNQIMKIIAKKRDQITGIVVSGGESSLQQGFIAELFKLAKADGLNTYIVSNGSQVYDSELLDLCAGIILTVKAYDRDRHIAITGKDNDQVLANLQLLMQNGKLREVRLVIIPKLLDNQQNVIEIGRLIAANNPNLRYKLIRYSTKRVRSEFGLDSIPSDEMMNELQALAVASGCNQVVVG